MKAILICSLLAGLLSAYGPVVNLVFEMDGNGSISLNELSLVEGEPTRFPESAGEYSIELVGKEGEVLRSHAFQPSFFLLTDPPAPMRTSLVGRRMEYVDGIESLVIRNATRILLERKLPRPAGCTADSICAEGENAFTCASDCDGSSPDGYCTGYLDGVCDPDCMQEADPDCEKTEVCCFPASLLALLAFRVIPEKRPERYPPRHNPPTGPRFS